MRNIPVKQPFHSMRSCVNPEQIVAEAKRVGLDFEYVQLTRRSFGVDFASAEYDGAVFAAAQARSHIAVKGKAPPGKVMVFTPFNDFESTLFNNEELRPDKVFLLAPGAELDVVAKRGTTVAQMIIDQHRFERGCADIRHGEKAAILNGSMQFENEYISKHLRDCATGLFTDPANFHKYYRPSVSELIRQIVRAVQKARIRDALTCAPLLSLAIAREYIHANIHETIKLADICGEAGVGVRTLERMFQKYLGVTPVVYIRACRLHAVRSKLLDDSNANVSIAELAQTCGFSHLGRFSGYYADYFGELPSETQYRQKMVA